MKPFILAIALMATGGCATTQVTLLFMGRTQTGTFLFNLGGVHMDCVPIEKEALCYVQKADLWFRCELLDPEEGYFRNCRETEKPTVGLAV